jgi:Domain of unknown function (DUF4388)
MSIAGNLKTMQLAELLQWLSTSKKTGALVIDNGHVQKKIYFKDGNLFSSASTDPKEYLGHFLVSHGFISELELSKAIEMQERSKMLLGKILVTIGAISESDLHRLLRLKAEESIYDVFAWDEGEFRFLDGDLPVSTLIPMNLDITTIIMEGAQRIDEWRRIRERIPSAEAIPVAMGELDDPKLSSGARQILSLVNDDRTVEEIRLQTHSSEFFVCRVLFQQVERGRLKVVKPRWNHTTSHVAGGNGNGASDGDVAAEALLKSAEKYLKRKEYETALRHLRAARSLDPESKVVGEAVKKGEDQVRSAVEKAGVKLNSVPKLNVTMDQLTTLKLNPQEGFMITRINGTYDLQSIIKISPIPQIDALLVFLRLLQAGHIRFE